MHRIFQRHIDLLSSATDLEGFSDAMGVTAAALDLSRFAYLALPSQQDKKPLVLSTYPTNWVTHYLENHYERFDPVVLGALQNPEPFKWGVGLSTKGMSSTQQALLDEASQFGIRSGFTIPIHDGHGPVAALTFAADQGQLRFERWIDSHERVLQLMAMYFHAHIRRKITNELKVDGVLLSRRELECLEWASQGKSAWEIGRILGISRNTAASYLSNAREKLGVRTVVQAATRLATAKAEQQK